MIYIGKVKGLLKRLTMMKENRINPEMKVRGREGKSLHRLGDLGGSS